MNDEYEDEDDFEYHEDDADDRAENGMSPAGERAYQASRWRKVYADIDDQYPGLMDQWNR